VFLAAALALSQLVAPQAHGLYFEQTTIVYVDGEPAGPGVRTRAWHSGRGLRLESGETDGGPSLILRLDLDRAWRLDPGEKVAVELDTKRLRARSQADAALAGSLIGAGDGGAVRTRALEGSRTLAGHACRGFRLRGPSVDMIFWVAEDLPIGVDAFADFLEWSGASQSLGGLLQEIRALPGFPLQTRARVDALGEVRETVSTVTLIRAGPQPEDRFEVPEGWRVVPEPPADTSQGDPE
jgi:hypothetical protein